MVVIRIEYKSSDEFFRYSKRSAQDIIDSRLDQPVRISVNGIWITPEFLGASDFNEWVKRRGG